MKLTLWDSTVVCRPCVNSYGMVVCLSSTYKIPDLVEGEFYNYKADLKYVTTKLKRKWKRKRMAGGERRSDEGISTCTYNGMYMNYVLLMEVDK